MIPKLLQDKHRLQEIYNLRVLAYENSPYANYVNWNLWPNGYYDDLDSLDTTSHWIIEDDNHKIIGSARLSILDDIKHIKEDLSTLDLPSARPFAYGGKTVVHPDFRMNRASYRLEKEIIDYIKKNRQIRFCLCFSTPERVDILTKMGFKNIGQINFDWGNKKLLPFDALILDN